MVTILRGDNKLWAIPGGMVDPGEKVSNTLKREFMEEALDSHGKSLKNIVLLINYIMCGLIHNRWERNDREIFHKRQGSV